MQSPYRLSFSIPVSLLIVGLFVFTATVEAHAQVAFMSERDGNKEVYVLGADGRTLRNLTNHSADDWTPSWSPDGNRIAFMSNRDNNNEIYVMDADGGDPRRLTVHPRSDGSPSWSPSGRHIVFVSGRDCAKR